MYQCRRKVPMLINLLRLFNTCTIAIGLISRDFDAPDWQEEGKKYLKRSSATTLYGKRDKKPHHAGNSSLIWSARIQLSFFFLVSYHRQAVAPRYYLAWLFATVIGFCSLNFPFHVDAFDVIYGFIKVFNFRCSV